MGEGALLEGIRVVDAADGAGELCGRLLADLGAQVVRVEPPGGSASRRRAPLADDGTSLWFAWRNLGESSIEIDPRRAGDRQRLDVLLAGADAYIDGSRPGDGRPTGLSPAELRVAHPHLVVTSVSDFGEWGPNRDWVGTDLVASAFAGALFKGGRADREPLPPPGSFAYDVTGVSAALATLLGLVGAGGSGHGRHLEVAAVEAVAQVTDWSIPMASMLAAFGIEYGETRQGSGPMYPIFPCRDGYVRVVILSARQWRALWSWMGEPEEFADDHWDAVVARLAVMDVLGPMIADLFANYDRIELAEEAQRRGIAVTPVLAPAEVLDTPHFVERGTFADHELAPGLRVRTPAGFFRVDGERVGPRGPAGVPAGASDMEAWAARPAPAGTAHPGRYPLEGVVVADFGIGGVGVEAGRLLGEYGADVIKVESHRYPDFIRIITGSMTSPSFVSSSRSKRSLGVDLKSDEGRAVVAELIRRADIVIENGATGVTAGLGFGPDDVARLNPDAVMVSSQLLGSTGPWSHFIGYGPSTRPVSGMSHLWRYPDEDAPAESTAIHPDHLAGRLCAVAAVAGLLRRRRGGGGAHIEVAQTEAVIGMLGDLYLAEAIRPGSTPTSGEPPADAAPWGLYRCAGEDRWCAVTVRDDQDWSRLVGALGSPGWATEPELATAAGRVKHRDLLDKQLGSWTAERSPDEVAEVLQGVGVPAAPMRTASTLLSDPHFTTRSWAIGLTQPGLGDLDLEGPAFRDDTLPDGPRTWPSPGLGEQTREICVDLLGLSPEGVEELLVADVLEEPRDANPA